MFNRGAVILFAVLAATGCAGPAIEAMNGAHEAIAMARQAQAERFAPVPMTRAVANYELARDSIVKDTRRGNRMARQFAIQAIEQARRSESEARVAIETEQKRRRETYEEESRRREETRKRDEDPKLVARRYMALAQRRLRFAAMAKMGATQPPGFVEVEVWIAPNGRVAQIIIMQGDPESTLARTVIQGIKELKMDPFPESITQPYLKLRVTIDTR